MIAKKRHWEPEEDRMLMTLYTEKGKRWKEISKSFHERSGNDIKNRFYSTLRRVARKDGINVKSMGPNSKLLVYVEKALSSSHLCYSKRGRKKKNDEANAHVIKRDLQAEINLQEYNRRESSLSAQRKRLKEEFVKNQQAINEGIIRLLHVIDEASIKQIGYFRPKLKDFLSEGREFHEHCELLLGKINEERNALMEQKKI